MASIRLGAEQPLRRGDRDVHLVVAVHAEALPERREHPDHPEPHAGDGDLLADRVAVAEQRPGHAWSRAPRPAGRCPRRCGSGSVPVRRSRTNTFGVVSSTPMHAGERRTALPARTVSPEVSVTATRSRSPTIRATASTSDSVQPGDRRRGAEARPGRAPRSAGWSRAPRPAARPVAWCRCRCATRTTTAATPMTTPSMVRPLRSRLARSASSATRHASAEPHVTPRIGHDHPVAHGDLAPGAGGDLAVVGDQDHRDARSRVELLEQVEHGAGRSRCRGCRWARRPAAPPAR